MLAIIDNEWLQRSIKMFFLVYFHLVWITYKIMNVVSLEIKLALYWQFNWKTFNVWDEWNGKKCLEMNELVWFAGMIAPMETVISAAMYHDIAAMKLKGQKKWVRDHYVFPFFV